MLIYHPNLIQAKRGQIYLINKALGKLNKSVPFFFFLPDEKSITDTSCTYNFFAN